MARRRSPLLLLGLCFLLSLAPGARAKETLAYEKHVLDNGLTVILHEDHRLPLVAVDIWYHVGSREERAGRSGFAHLFEHLMFMGTERVPRGQFDAIMEAEGAWNNASTDFDRTDYYAVGPARLLPTLLWLEADRMESLGAAMTQEKLDLQRDVVHNEIRESYDNAPYGPAELRLYEETFPPGHPYHHHVIGSHEDLAEATVADVEAFFAAYYVPNNATLVIAGDFEAKPTLELVERLFGTIPRAPDPPRPTAPPARFATERRVSVPDDVRRARTILAWHTPAYFAPGDAELDLVASILADGRNGRLYKRLVHEERIALDVAAWQESMRLGSLFRIQATAAPGTPLDAVEAAIDEELARLAKEGPTVLELNRARALIETDIVADLQSLLSVADRLNTYDAYLGTPDRLAWDLDRYRNATPESVATWARLALVPDCRLVLRVVPGRKVPAAPSARDERPSDLPDRPFTPDLPNVFRLENGLEVWHLDRPELPLVTARLVLRDGSARDPAGAAGLADLAGRMLLEGAGDLDALAFAAALQARGTRLWVDVGRESTVLGFQVLRRHVEDVLELLALALQTPRFAPDDWTRVRERRVRRLEQIADEPEALAARVAWHAFFTGARAAYGHPTSGFPDTVAGLALDDARRFHAHYHTPARGVLLIAGDLRREEAERWTRAHLGAWRGSTVAPPAPAEPVPGAGSGKRLLLVDRPGAEQTVIQVLLPAVAWPEARDGVLRVTNEILGGSFTSRLNATLREEKGYTYGAYSSLALYRHAGVLEASTAVQTEVTGAALGALLAEIRRLGEDDVTAAEVARAVATLRSSAVQSFADLAGILGVYVPYARGGVPPAGFREDLQRVERMDVEAVHHAARRHATLADAVLVLVGDRARITPQLEGLGWPEAVVLTPEEALRSPTPSGAR